MPCNYPVLGNDAFRTATGVHAATVIKAMKKESDVWLADAVYCGVPASMVGLKQRIEIGPMSGKSNVIFWLEDRNINPTDELVEMVFNKAKQVDTILSEDEINKIIIGMFRKKEVMA
jgi:2-isopropylmalate synthase